jgi:hypothetical protein
MCENQQYRPPPGAITSAYRTVGGESRILEPQSSFLRKIERTLGGGCGGLGDLPGTTRLADEVRGHGYRRHLEYRVIGAPDGANERKHDGNRVMVGGERRER